MSVNIEQVREALGSAITPREDVWREMMRQMADEIEALRAERDELVDVMKVIASEKLPFYQHQIVAHRILSKIKMREMIGGNNESE